LGCIAIITSATQNAALVGMGGVGKSVLAVALARDCQVRRAFADGIIWLTIGLQPNLVGLLKSIGLALGAKNLLVSPGNS
jgi:hypothetical protein